MIIGNEQCRPEQTGMCEVPSPYKLVGEGKDLRAEYRFEILAEWWEIKFGIDSSKIKPVKFSILREASCWGVQIEQGEFPTTFIPTHSTAATREGDSVYLPAADTVAIDFAAAELPRQSMAMVNTRATPAYVVTNGELVRFEPGESRIIEREGLLLEETRTNYVTHTSLEDGGYDWDTQQMVLKPGKYVLTWYGAGSVYIRAPRIWDLIN